jgi:thiosulfate dehydrogenase [quinone] large subunit
MASYFQALGKAFQDWKKAVAVLVFTIVRLVFGWSWVTAGWEKLGWLSSVSAPAGQPVPVSNSAGLIQVMVDHLAGPAVKHFDPLYLNNLFAWVAQNIFLGIPRVTDYLVVIFELGVGILLILGIRVFWTALAAIFLNLQFYAAGSFNNFGYVWTDLALLKWAKVFDVIGVDGIVRAGRGKDLV